MQSFTLTAITAERNTSINFDIVSGAYNVCPEHQVMVGEHGGLVFNALDSGFRGRGFESYSSQTVLCP